MKFGFLIPEEEGLDEFQVLQDRMESDHIGFTFVKNDYSPETNSNGINQEKDHLDFNMLDKFLLHDLPSLPRAQPAPTPIQSISRNQNNNTDMIKTLKEAFPLRVNYNQKSWLISPPEEKDLKEKEVNVRLAGWDKQMQRYLLNSKHKKQSWDTGEINTPFLMQRNVKNIHPFFY